MSTKKIKIYRLKPYLRIITVSIVLLISVISTVIALPLAELLNLDLSELQGDGFNPTGKTLTVVVLYAGFQFLLVWLAIRFIHKRPFKTLGFKGPVIKPLLLGTVAGMLMQSAEYLLYYIYGSEMSLNVSIPNDVNNIRIIGYFLLLVLFLLSLNSLKEELVFRAYPIQLFDDFPNLMIPLLILVSLAFAGVHHVLEPFTWDAFASRFTIALLLSFVFYRWRSIWLISGIHNGLNLVSYLTSGNYKTAGLLDLSIQSYPSEINCILIDFALAAAFIVLFNFIWKKEKQNKGYFFNIIHPK